MAPTMISNIKPLSGGRGPAKLLTGTSCGRVLGAMPTARRGHGVISSTHFVAVLKCCSAKSRNAFQSAGTAMWPLLW